MFSFWISALALDSLASRRPVQTVLISLNIYHLDSYEFSVVPREIQGQASEWALLRRHEEEDIFGVQICGSYADTVSRAAELIERKCIIGFIDLNLGCPIDVVVNKGGGSSLLTKPQRLQEIVKATSASIDTPLTLKVKAVTDFLDSSYFLNKIAFGFLFFFQEQSDCFGLIRYV